MSATASGSFSVNPDPLSPTSGVTVVKIDPSSPPLQVNLSPNSLVGIDTAANTVKVDPDSLAALLAAENLILQAIKDLKAGSGGTGGSGGSGGGTVKIDPSSLPLSVKVQPGSLVGIDAGANTVKLDPDTIALLIAGDNIPQQQIREVKGSLTFGAGVNAPNGNITIPAKTVSVTFFNLSPLLLMLRMTDGSEFYIPPNGTWNFENLNAQSAATEEYSFNYIPPGAVSVSSMGNSGQNFNGISPRLLVNFRTIV